MGSGTVGDGMGRWSGTGAGLVSGGALGLRFIVRMGAEFIRLMRD
jgi:hypothetical protein